jgi:hypothetical protein
LAAPLAVQVGYGVSSNAEMVDGGKHYRRVRD